MPTYLGQLRSLRLLALRALDGWGLADARVDFVCFGENTAYRVRHGRRDCLLRVSRPDLQTMDTLRSEMMWLDALRQSGIRAPRPIELTAIDGRGVALLSWTTGRFRKRWNDGCWRALGELTAKLHVHAEGWTPPDGFVRMRWDIDGMCCQPSVWGSPEAFPLLTDDDRSMLARTRIRIRQDLASLPPADVIVHTDLHRNNVLFDRGETVPIDFDDCGWSWFVMDCVNSVGTPGADPGYDARLACWLEGYDRIRPFPREQLAWAPAISAGRHMTGMAWAAWRWDVPRLRNGAEHRLKWTRGVLRRYLGEQT